MKNFKLLYVLLFAFNIPLSILSQEIKEEMMLNSLKILASDSLEGRGFGTVGNYKARMFMANQFKELGIAPAWETGYIQAFDHAVPNRPRHGAHVKKDTTVSDTVLVGANVVAKIPGKTDKVIAITGHIDHLGIIKGEIFNGADDDASGTAALLAIADYFQQHPPNHTLILAAVDAEEIGSPGCKYLLDNFPLPAENIVLNVNMDMISHSDKILYACGTYHYPQLKKYIEQVETPLEILFGHDDPNNKKLDDWTNSSDHRVFHNKGIPFMYFGVEDHKDYHKASDEYSTINPDFYVKAVKVIIQAIEAFDAGE